MFITAKDEYGNDVSAEQAVDGTNHYTGTAIIYQLV